MKIPSAHELVQQFIIGVVCTAVFGGVWWLIAGTLPDGVELWAGSLALMWTGSTFLRVQKAREVRFLRELYEGPAADEK